MFTAFDWPIFWTNLIKVAAAYALAMPVGWDRESEAHSAGLRTFPIVAMASCGYLLLMPDMTTQSRVLQGVVTGIGFVGGGAILKSGDAVRGTATAASIWNTGVIGAAIAIERYEIALILSLLNLFTLKALLPLKRKLDEPPASTENKGI
ncbi:MAG: MgtC/SapB family protein [Acidobacteriota bacterium]|nr:MgtC/SapB family protein [Acidobacteriota bacterium]